MDVVTCQIIKSIIYSEINKYCNKPHGKNIFYEKLINRNYVLTDVKKSSRKNKYEYFSIMRFSSDIYFVYIYQNSSLEISSYTNINDIISKGKDFEIKITKNK